jgi:hypothetical protein
MSAVYICYSRKDASFVRALQAELVKRDWETWVDVDNIAPTADWLTSVYSGIEETDAFVFVISPDSVRSEVNLRELAHAVENNKRIVPLVHRDVDDEDVPQPLASYRWIFYRESDDFDDAIQSLLEALNTDRPSRRPPRHRPRRRPGHSRLAPRTA